MLSPMPLQTPRWLHFGLNLVPFGYEHREKARLGLVKPFTNLSRRALESGIDFEWGPSGYKGGRSNPKHSKI